MSPRGVPQNRPLAIDAEAQMYAQASEIAALAMGDTATKDPLALWCLVELLVKFAGRNASAARKTFYANRRVPE